MQNKDLMPQKNIHIRRGNKEDIPEIYRLVKELAIYEKAEEELTTTIEYYYRQFEDGLFKTIVADKGEGKLVGMMLFFDAFSTWKGKMLWLEDFVVEQSMRKRGIGQKLFDELIAYGKKHQYVLIKWEVLDWNEPAISFYKKIGARLETNWWDGKYFLEDH